MLTALLLFAAQASAEPDIVVTGRVWAPFISPMGEPYRAKSTAEDTMANWFRRADSDGNGWLTAAEMSADAARFFIRLDRDDNGVIEPEEMSHYEWEVAPEIQVNARPRRAPGETKPKKELRPRDPDALLQGAARYALLNLPQPVAAADSDFDRDVDRAEFARAAAHRFALLDVQRRGQIPYADLVAMRTKLLADAAKKSRRRVRSGDDHDDVRVATPL